MRTPPEDNSIFSESTANACGVVFLVFGVFGCGVWLWVVVGGRGWFWWVVVGCGWLWVVVVGYGWLWCGRGVDEMCLSISITRMHLIAWQPASWPP